MYLPLVHHIRSATAAGKLPSRRAYDGGLRWDPALAPVIRECRSGEKQQLEQARSKPKQCRAALLVSTILTCLRDFGSWRMCRVSL
jgi:hypothetical protein